VGHSVNITLKIGGKVVPVELVCPNRIGTRWAVVLAVQNAGNTSAELIYVAAAALGLGWPRMASWDRAPTYAPGRFLEYGAAMLDYLLDHGVSPVDIMKTGLEAYKMMREDLVTAEEVVDAGDFSSAAPSEPLSVAAERTGDGPSSISGNGFRP
jgi:hypothetical protein